MSFAFGRHQLSIPGPSVIPDRVLNAMHIPAPNIYEGALIETTHSVFADLKKVARTKGDVVLYIANGHGAWEGALVNAFAPGDLVLVLCTGRFGKGWADMASNLGIDVETVDFGDDAAADPAQLTARLQQDVDHRIKGILTVQTDTASSVSNDIKALRDAIDAANHPALFGVDCIASLACERFEMDAWGVDLMVAGCQKGLMTPPGLSFNFVGAKALTARQKRKSVSPYFDWLPRIYPDVFYQLFCGTPPTHHLFGLRAALDILLLEEGLENVWNRHQALAQIVWVAADVWAEKGALRCNIADKAARSRAVTTIHTAPGDAEKLRQWCDANAGLTLGIGLGLGGPHAGTADSIFRIGHMGHLNPPMIMGALGTIDAGLKALGIEHGGGALRVASEEVARTLTSGTKSNT